MCPIPYDGFFLADKYKRKNIIQMLSLVLFPTNEQTTQDTSRTVTRNSSNTIPTLTFSKSATSNS